MNAAMDMRGDMISSIRTLWCWLRGALRIHAADDRRWLSAVIPVRAPVDPVRQQVETEPGLMPQPGGPAPERQRGVLLQFPLRGEAMLVKLADSLKSRMASAEAKYGSERDPLLMTMSRGPGSRLWIDRRAYVEFDAALSAYCMTIEATPDTTVALDTTDFDTLVNFVMRYVDERLAPSATLEVAS